MSMDNVQLKQENVVGENVVLEDINPVTNTLSIDDSSSGEKLSVIINKIWAAINNKLERVVNSVNGRTGVVVLTSEDVGLSNVDNVSFEDIKQWVIETFEELFGKTHFRLYETFDHVRQDMEQEGRTLANVPFYVERGPKVQTEQGYIDDWRSYIGYFYWNDATNQLAYDVRAINSIGYTDSSLLYIKDKNDFRSNDNINELPIGGIGVNIAPEEDALKVRQSLNPSEGGMYIDKAALAGRIYYFEGVYGPSNAIGNNQSLLGYTTQGSVGLIDPDRVIQFVFDDDEYHLIMGNMRLNDGYSIDNPRFRVGDILICNFIPYLQAAFKEANPALYHDGMDKALMFHHTCIGRVTTVQDHDTHLATIIKFYSIKPIVGHGLMYNATHKDETHPDTEISLNLASSNFSQIESSQYANVSGLNAFKNAKDQNPEGILEPIEMLDKSANITFPWSGDLNGNTVNIDGGLTIEMDNSLCAIPMKFARAGNINGDAYEWRSGADASEIANKDIDFFRPYGSKAVGNWHHPFPYYDRENETNEGGKLTDKCLLGVNLTKMIDQRVNPYDPTKEDPDFHGSEYNIYNMSGLRVNLGYDVRYDGGRNVASDAININVMLGENIRSFMYSYTGMMDGKDYAGTPLSELLPNEMGDIGNVTTLLGGGLSINTGKFLEIRPQITKTSQEYYDGGKIQVRPGNGLTEQYDYIILWKQGNATPESWDTNFIPNDIFEEKNGSYKYWGKDENIICIPREFDDLALNTDGKYFQKNIMSDIPTIPSYESYPPPGGTNKVPDDWPTYFTQHVKWKITREEYATEHEYQTALLDLHVDTNGYYHPTYEDDDVILITKVSEYNAHKTNDTTYFDVIPDITQPPESCGSRYFVSYTRNDKTRYYPLYFQANLLSPIKIYDLTENYTYNTPSGTPVPLSKHRIIRVKRNIAKNPERIDEITLDCLVMVDHFIPCSTEDTKYKNLEKDIENHYVHPIENLYGRSQMYLSCSINMLMLAVPGQYPKTYQPDAFYIFMGRVCPPSQVAEVASIYYRLPTNRLTIDADLNTIELNKDHTLSVVSPVLTYEIGESYQLNQLLEHDGQIYFVIKDYVSFIPNPGEYNTRKQYLSLLYSNDYSTEDDMPPYYDYTKYGKYETYQSQGVFRDIENGYLSDSFTRGAVVEWEEGASYPYGQLVMHEGKLYLVIKSYGTYKAISIEADIANGYLSNAFNTSIRKILQFRDTRGRNFEFDPAGTKSTRADESKLDGNEAKLARYREYEYVRVGPGLKITGGKLPKEALCIKSELRSALLEEVDRMSVAEEIMYAKTLDPSFGSSNVFSYETNEEYSAERYVAGKQYKMGDWVRQGPTLYLCIKNYTDGDYYAITAADDTLNGYLQQGDTVNTNAGTVEGVVSLQNVLDFDESFIAEVSTVSENVEEAIIKNRILTDNSTITELRKFKDTLDLIREKLQDPKVFYPGRKEYLLDDWRTLQNRTRLMVLSANSKSTARDLYANLVEYLFGSGSTIQPTFKAIQDATADFLNIEIRKLEYIFNDWWAMVYNAADMVASFVDDPSANRCDYCACGDLDVVCNYDCAHCTRNPDNIESAYYAYATPSNPTSQENALPVYSGMSYELSDIIYYIPYGTRCRCITTDDENWVKLVYNGRLGYAVKNQFTLPQDYTTIPETPLYCDVVVYNEYNATTYALHLYSEMNASDMYKITPSIPKPAGQTLTIQNDHFTIQNNEWTQLTNITVGVDQTITGYIETGRLRFYNT